MNLLFHDDLAVAVLGSGSRGNCTYIGNGRHGVLVDCGISTRQVLQRLEAIGLGSAPIDAVLITHEHTDHVGAAAILDRRLSRQRPSPLPFHMTAGTAENLNPKVRPRQVVSVTPGQPFRVGSLLVEACTVPHDTLDPVAFTVESRGARAGVLTDLGRSTRLVERQLATLDVAVLEFNHDVEMLIEGSYPWPLKQRIRGPHGHLSNDQAAELLVRGASARLRHLMLAHLSEENNRPDKALAAAAAALHRAGMRRVEVQVAAQDTPLPPVHAPPIVPPPARRPARTPVRTRAAEPSPQAQVALFQS